MSPCTAILCYAAKRKTYLRLLHRRTTRGVVERLSAASVMISMGFVTCCPFGLTISMCIRMRARRDYARSECRFRWTGRSICSRRCDNHTMLLRLANVRHDRACSGNAPVSVSGVCIVRLESVCLRYHRPCLTACFSSQTTC
jgi:hypothetical protein